MTILLEAYLVVETLFEWLKLMYHGPLKHTANLLTNLRVSTQVLESVGGSGQEKPRCVG